MAEYGPKVYVRIPDLNVQEGSSFNATINYRQDGADVTPAASTVKYRVDCLTSDKVILDWTVTATPTQPMDLAMISTYNDIQHKSNRREKKQLTVTYNKASDDQFTTRATWYVDNLVGTET